MLQKHHFLNPRNRITADREQTGCPYSLTVSDLLAYLANSCLLPEDVSNLGLRVKRSVLPAGTPMWKQKKRAWVLWPLQQELSSSSWVGSEEQRGSRQTQAVTLYSHSHTGRLITQGTKDLLSAQSGMSLNEVWNALP